MFKLSELIKPALFLALMAIAGLAASPFIADTVKAAPSAIATAPTLGTAASYAVVGASTVTNTGPSIVTGDLGLHPGTSVTGFDFSTTPGPGIVTGAVHIADAAALQAQSDVTIAYLDLEAQACDTDRTATPDIGGDTLIPGVYCFDTSAALTGAVTLSGGPADVWVFQIGSTLTTASASSVVFTGGASPCNVFWQVGSSATLDTTTAFAGNILAMVSITMNTGASVSGRALARTGAVTLDNTNAVSAACGGPEPPPGTLPVAKVATKIHFQNHAAVPCFAAGCNGQVAPAGSVVHDLAIVTSSISGMTPTGSVTFGFFVGNLHCMGNPTSLESVALAGSLATTSGESSNTAPLAAGHYSYRAIYFPDAAASALGFKRTPGKCEQLGVG